VRVLALLRRRHFPTLYLTRVTAQAADGIFQASLASAVFFNPDHQTDPTQAAAGFVVHLFPTGQGNVIGNPIEPVIKLTANPRTARTMREHIDLDVSGLLRREMNLDKAGDRLIELMLRTCNGRLTCAEALGHREFVMTKLYQSA